jgi:biopolymer transport protein ExbB
LLGIVQSLGWPLWPLIIASVLAFALIFERTIALRHDRILPPGLCDEVLGLVARRQMPPDMLDKLQANSPLGNLLASGLRRHGSSRDHMEKSMEAAGNLISHHLSRYVSLLGGIGSVAPLLGLLGTVVGMIDIFSSQQGGANPQQLAQGISVALYSTAFGILVAVPSVLAYRLIKVRIDGLLLDLEHEGQRLLDAMYPPARPGGQA